MSLEEQHLTCPRFVVENGTFSTKCGLAGEETPNFIKLQNRKNELMKNGQIENFEKFPEYLELCLKQSFNNFLNTKNKKNDQIKDESFKLLITEKIITPKNNREELIKLSFESLKCSEYFAALDSILLLYSSGRTTGSVINFNYNNTTIACAYEGYMLPHTVRNNDKINHITLENYLCKYKLPDGRVFYVGQEKFKCMEMYFNDNLSVQKLLDESIGKCDLDIQYEMRKDVIANGSLSIIKEMKDRIKFGHNDWKRSKFDANKVSTVDSKKYPTWIGGRILAALTTFSEMCITTDEYNESGPGIVHRKCF